LFVQTDATHQVYEYTNDGPDVGSPDHFVDVMTQPYADLQVPSVTADSTGQSGQSISVSWTVANNGIGPTNIDNWNDQVWISADQTGKSGLRLLGNFNHIGTLRPGDGYTRTVDVPLPGDLGGTYYAAVSPGGPFEFISTSNNSGVSGPINVVHINPPQVDLQTTAVGAPDTIHEGQSADITWT